MPQYAYTARTADGQDVAGTMTAGSKREMLEALAEKKLFPLRVDDAGTKRNWFAAGGRVPAGLVASTLSQLADLLVNGVPLLRALRLLADQSTNARLSEILEDICAKVTEGTSLDAAMEGHPRVFNELAVSMVRAGAEGAFLEDALKRIADFMELQEELKSRLKGAMFYPAFLAVLGTVVTTSLIVFFVPKFSELFERLEQDGGGLPFATVLLLGLSDFLGRFGVVILAALAGLVWWLKRFFAGSTGRRILDRWKLKLPVLGPIFTNSALSRFCRVFGTLLKNGVPMLKSLEISSTSTGNVILTEAVRQASENVSAGETLARPLAACGLFPRSIMAMITVAEESNNLENVLVSIADGLDRQMERRLDMMVRMVEPVMLLLMGCGIGFVMVALLLPVFEMSNAMS